jgi:hypothetical protein
MDYCHRSILDPNYSNLFEFTCVDVDLFAGKLIYTDYSILGNLKSIKKSAARSVILILGQWGTKCLGGGVNADP